MIGLLVRFAVFAALTWSPGGAVEPALAHTRYTLPNGLEVILRPVRNVPLVAVHVRFHVGGADDPRGQRGLAHIVEHLSSDGGTTHIIGERAAASRFYIGAVGANASTMMTSTNYFMTVPANYLEIALWIESDRMSFIPGTTTRGGLYAAQRVVANERRERFDAEPYAQLTEQVYKVLYPEIHPYHGMLIGSLAEIDAVAVADADAFLKMWYTPANATLVLVGDLPGNTRALVDKYFASLPTSPPPPPHAAVDPAPLDREIRLQATEAFGRSARVTAAWRSPGAHTADDAVAKVLCDALSTGAGERIAAESSGGAVFQSSFGQVSEPTVSGFVVQMTGRVGESAVTLLSVIDHVLTRVGAGALSEDEVSRARERVITENLAELQSLAGQAERLQEYARDRTPDALAHELQRYRAVTPEAVARFARDVLRRDRRVVQLAEPAARATGAGEP